MRMALPLLLLAAVASTGCERAAEVLPFMHRLELDTADAKGWCGQMDDFWKRYSLADVSGKARPGDEDGVCAIPVSREKERLVLQTLTCTRTRGGPVGATQLAVTLVGAGSAARMALHFTDHTPTLSLSWGPGLLLDGDVVLDLDADQARVECWFNGYFVRGDAGVLSRPWGPGLRLPAHDEGGS